MDPVRKWTLIILVLCAIFAAWHLISDRLTPYSSQARLHALVVPIAPEVSGTVVSVAVSNNQRVEAGQELFQIDKSRYAFAVQTAEANLDAANQTLGASAANVEAARANVETAKVSQDSAQQDYDRQLRIREEDPGAISVRRLELSESALAATKSQIAGAQANLDKAIEDLGKEGADNSRILEAQSALDRAALDLKRTTVAAPEEGVVTGVRLDTGNFASAGQPQMTFISTKTIWVQADFTENNLGHLRRENKAEVLFDALPGRVFQGTVREIGFGVAVDSAPLGTLPTIENSQAWLRDAQRFPVLVDVEMQLNEAGRILKVGSQASVMVYTGDNALFNALGSFYIRVASYLTYVF